VTRETIQLNFYGVLARLNLASSDMTITMIKHALSAKAYTLHHDTDHGSCQKIDDPPGMWRF